ncbi:MAG TPA: gamma-glutamyl-gamma-aminobutyrate hydrolase family protein [Actinomycetota bacterium]|nr:gamma-glutamyl-gamma-aminobutyrate hydrolase family protein [Actinomycetota bacterium]
MPLLYIAAVRAAGGTPVVMATFDLPQEEKLPEDVEVIAGLDPYDSSILSDVAGLVVPGGGDIDPELYGCERHPRTHSVNHRRDLFEKTLLDEAMRKDLPVLAICHGMQLLNVVMGGTLNQHLADQAHLLDHDRDMPRAEPVHQLRVKERTALGTILHGETVEVNSHHHQGIASLASGLEEVAWAEDGVLEAVSATENTWVIGVQWHPEAMAPVDQRQRSIFEAFIAAAAAFQTGRASELAEAAATA